LESNAHGFVAPAGDLEAEVRSDAERAQKIDEDLATWNTLVQGSPQSRHALAGRALAYEAKAELTDNPESTRNAVTDYIDASRIGIKNGKIRYTERIASLLVQLKDVEKLKEFFAFVFAQPSSLDPFHYYSALVDYSRALDHLDDPEAEDYYRKALNVSLRI
jgi:hypothetical protein